MEIQWIYNIVYISGIQYSDTAIYAYLHVLCILFSSIIGHYKILIIFPCAIQQVLVGYLFYVFVVVQSLGRVQLSAAPWTAACQASLSFTASQSLLKFLSIVLMLPSNHLILCHPFSSCPQSFPVSGSFPMIVFSHQVAKVFELQLQRQSFQ